MWLQDVGGVDSAVDMSPACSGLVFLTVKKGCLTSGSSQEAVPRPPPAAGSQGADIKAGADNALPAVFPTLASSGTGVRGGGASSDTNR